MQRNKIILLFGSILCALTFAHGISETTISEFKYSDIRFSDDIFYIAFTYPQVDDIECILFDTLLDKKTTFSYSIPGRPFRFNFDVRNDNYGMAWIKYDLFNKKIMSTVFGVDSILDTNRIICLSGIDTISYNGTTHSDVRVEFINDSLLIGIWAQGDPDFDHFSIFGQLFTSSNELQGSNFRINELDKPGEINSKNPALKAFKDGSGFVVAWVDDRFENNQVFGRIFNHRGRAIDSSFLIGDGLQTFQSQGIDIDVDSLGDFLVSFVGLNSGGRNVYYRWYDKSGNPKSDCTPINDLTDKINFNSDVKCGISDDGKYSITWQNYEDSRRVFSQCFSPGNVSLSLPFWSALSDRTHSQDYPHTFLNNDKLYVFYQGDGSWANVIDINNAPVEVKDLSEDNESFELIENYPNPFNPITTMSYELPEQSDVKMIIHDISGRSIREWTRENQSAGNYEITWDAKDQHGNMLPSGVYIYSLFAGNQVESKKMVLLK